MCIYNIVCYKNGKLTPKKNYKSENYITNGRLPTFIFFQQIRCLEKIIKIKVEFIFIFFKNKKI